MYSRSSVLLRGTAKNLSGGKGRINAHGPFMAFLLNIIYILIPRPTKHNANNVFLPFRSHLILVWHPRILSCRV